MRGHSVYSEDFVELLEAFPEGLAVVRAYLQGGFGILVGVNRSQALWEAIEAERGEEGAADVVSELVLTKGGERVERLIRLASAGDTVHVRADDSQLVRLLFNGDGWETEVGSYVVNYFERSRPFLDEAEAEPEERVEEEPVDVEGTAEEPDDSPPGGPDLLDLFSGKPRLSAERGSDWTFERVQTPRRRFLTVPRDWKEADLEQFLWANWEKIDLGLDRPLYLVDRQVRLNPNTSDRVDLLARGRAGKWVPIELKIVEVGRGDFTQLLSYMADLERRGEPDHKVWGILAAPSFAGKVLKAAATDPRVTLLRFYVEE